MARGLPYFKWFPSDAEIDDKYSAMTDAELGFYHRCLNKAWMNGGLPADPEERARVMRTPRELADQYWKRVGKCFCASLGDSTKLVNPRQEMERDEASQRVAKKADAGRRSAEVRRSKRTGVEQMLEQTFNTDANTCCDSVEPRAYDSGSVSESDIETVSVKPESNRLEIVSLGRFEEFWAVWSKVRGTNHKNQAVRAWLSVIPDDATAQKCIDCTASYVASLDKPNKGYNPETFLFEQAKDGFHARFPPARASPVRSEYYESATERAIRIGQERMLREGRL